MFNTRGFFRTNSHSILDNLTVQDANEFRLDADNRYSTQSITNLTVSNISYFTFREGEFTNLCGGTMRGQVTVKDSSMYIDHAGYMSSTSGSTYCNDYE